MLRPFCLFAIAGALCLANAVAAPKAAPADQALGYLLQQQSAKSGLVRSYPEERHSHTYDDALALIAFLVSGKRAEADHLASALIRVQQQDGSFQDSYDFETSAPVQGDRFAGVNAWAAYALGRYARQPSAAHGKAAQTAAQKCCRWLVSLQQEDGRVTGGFDAGGGRLPWASTEHNLACWFLFREVDGYAAAAADVKKWLLTEAWNKDHFNRGHQDPVVATDCQSWGAVWLTLNGEPTKARQALAFAEQRLSTRSAIVGREVIGFPRSGIRRDVVWVEGTAQMAHAYASTGQKPPQPYLDSLLTLQNGDGSFVHSTKNIAQPEVWHSTMSSVAATAWVYFALLTRAGKPGAPFPMPKG